MTNEERKVVEKLVKDSYLRGMKDIESAIKDCIKVAEKITNPPDEQAKEEE